MNKVKESKARINYPSKPRTSNLDRFDYMWDLRFADL